jgi:hypothetical protein
MLKDLGLGSRDLDSCSAHFSILKGCCQESSSRYRVASQGKFLSTLNQLAGGQLSAEVKESIA